MTQAERDIKRKTAVLEHARATGNVAKTCRYFWISRQTFYDWKRAYLAKGEQGLINRRPGFKPGTHPKKMAPEIEEKVLLLRRRYHFGPEWISWYLQRYHGLEISSQGIYYALKRHGMNRLPRNQRKRSIRSFRRYEKQVPGHHVQIDVKFLTFTERDGAKTRRYQYTAIDDATRIRALKIYEKHNQKAAIDFVDYVLEKFPFRIHTIRTDNGHEFQAKFHWHVEDLGIQHVYIKPRTPRLNGKVERSHLTDEREFYQLLEYKGDMDLNQRLEEWEQFYNLHRPHGAHHGKTPYEALVDKLKSVKKNVSRGV